MSEKVLNRPCPVCGNTTGELLHVQRFADTDDLGTSRSVDIVSCSRCACGFSDLNNSQADLDKAYEEHSKYADMSVFAEVNDENPMQAESPWDLDRLTRTAAWLATNVPSRSLRILDAGCATGTLIGLLQRYEFSDLVGLDPSPLATATTAHHYNVPTITGSFCSPPESIGEFDVVILSHVLEHIADVKSAADGLASMVKPEGLVYLEVPDAVRYQDFLVAPYHDFNNEHINHFSLHCLDHMLGSRGFERISGGSKEVPIAPKVMYPAAFGLWKKTGKIAQLVGFDSELRSALHRYIDESSRMLGRMDAWLRSILSNEPIAIWGAGNLTLKLLDSTVLRDARVTVIVDGSRQRQGIRLNGLTVQDPSALATFEGTVIVSSLHHANSIFSAAQNIVGPKTKVLRFSA